MSLNLGQGPYDVYYDGQLLEGIETVAFTIAEDTASIATIEGQKITIVKAHSAEVKLTFVDTGIANLKKIVPDAWLSNGQQVNGQAAGNVVNFADGAIALGTTASGGDSALTAPLQIVPSTGANDHTLTLFDGVATLTDIQIADQVIKADVTIRSEAVGVQLLKGKVTLIS